MLVLSRKIGESIILPDSGVSIVLLSIRGGRARIGIEGPPNAAIHRAEVWCRIAREEGLSPTESPAPPSECQREPVSRTVLCPA